MNIHLVAGAVAAALFASPAFASEVLPVGAPSEPTVWGHPAAESRAAVEIAPVGLRTSEAPAARSGFAPSEPTVWGHRPEIVR